MSNLTEDKRGTTPSQFDDECPLPPQPTIDELQGEWDALSSETQAEIWHDFHSDRRYGDEPVAGHWYPLLRRLSRQRT